MLDGKTIKIKTFTQFNIILNFRAILIFLIGVIVVKTVSVITGLIMFSKYAGCDPLTTGSINRPDQLLPYYVMDVAGHILGLPGLFIAGVFCAALR